MKQLLLISVLFVTTFSQAQTPQEFTVEIEPLTITNAPGVQSFAWGKTSDEKWVVFGGRIDGLHQRQPFASFLETDNNKTIFVIDPVGEQVWSTSIDVLPASLFEQLQSTNQQFYQDSTTLYTTGGYGYSTTAGDHVTYPYLTAIDLDGVADAVINQTSIVPYFRQITDTNLQVTGGHLGYLNGYYYLVGGQMFEGQYNPMGPTHGPGFVQVYTNEIRKFQIVDDGVNMSVQNYSAIHDTTDLHRRDYNMSPQIFPDGTEGFTAFSGVFNPSDLPWLNCVNVFESNYSVIPNFNQYLSQYHSSKVPIFDADANTMHTLFFGGLSQYTLDANNTLIEDPDVPFVKTISRITRNSDWSMEEIELSYIEMPTLVGPGAEFIPVDGYYLPREILDLNAVPSTKTLIGYIYGGIESSAENIFFVNDGTQSWASNVIFKVYINKSAASIEEVTIGGHEVFDMVIYPVPVRNKLNVEFNMLRMEEIEVRVVDSSGKIVHVQQWKPEDTGWQKLKIDTGGLDAGTYRIVLDNGDYSTTKGFTKR